MPDIGNTSKISLVTVHDLLEERLEEARMLLGRTQSIADFLNGPRPEEPSSESPAPAPRNIVEALDSKLRRLGMYQHQLYEELSSIDSRLL